MLSDENKILLTGTKNNKIAKTKTATATKIYGKTAFFSTRSNLSLGVSLSAKCNSLSILFFSKMLTKIAEVISVKIEIAASGTRPSGNLVKIIIEKNKIKVQDIINTTYEKYTKEEAKDKKEQIKTEILEEIDEMLDTKTVVDISFGSITYQ